MAPTGQRRSNHPGQRGTPQQGSTNRPDATHSHPNIIMTSSVVLLLLFSALLQLSWARRRFFSAPHDSCYADEFFLCRPGCTYSGAIPYRRESHLGCQECLDLCRDDFCNWSGGYRCFSVIFDSQFQTCDLFAVTDGPAYPLQFWGLTRTYFRPLGQCPIAPVTTAKTTESWTTPKTAAPPTASPPTTTTYTIPTIITSPTTSKPTETCPPGTILTAFFSVGYALKGTIGDQNPSEDCRTSCSRTDSEKFLCRSASSYTITPNWCQFSSILIENRPFGEKLQKSSDAQYYEKLCLTVGTFDPRRCQPRPIFVDPQHNLEGFALQTIHQVENRIKCVELCYSLAHCQSGMYWYDKGHLMQTCVLNWAKKDAAEEPQSRYQEISSEELVDYFELNGCPDTTGVKPYPNELLGGSNELLVRDFQPRKGRPSGHSLNSWTDWSDCDSETNKQIRYRRCQQLNLHKCPHQKVSCIPQQNNEEVNGISSRFYLKFPPVVNVHSSDSAASGNPFKSSISVVHVD